MIFSHTNKTIISSVFILLIIVLFMFFQKDTLDKTEIKGLIITQLNAENNTTTNTVDITSNKIINKNTIKSKHIDLFKGSKPDGAINIDNNGMIIIDHELKRLFDYYFTVIGELTMLEIKQQLKQFVKAQLDTAQISQLMNLFDKYIKYLNSYASFTQSISTDHTQTQRLLLISEFRIRILGSEMATAFFSNEENYIAFVLSDKYTDDGKFSDQQMEWLESENNATQYLDTIHENKIFYESELITETDIYNYRVEQYGQEAAQRLAQLDSERAIWQQTVAEYNAQRQLIENNQSEISLSDLHGQYSDQVSRRLMGLYRVHQ